MKLIVGLGNPGEKYENTRHNVGFMVVDKIASDFGIKNYGSSKKGKADYAWAEINENKIELLKPQTFMNESGFSVQYAKKNHPELNNSDVLVIHDDLDISLGSYKLQFGKGPKLHNGVLSVERELSTKDFWRLRVGVEGRIKNSEIRIKGEDYVLANFTRKEREILAGLIEGRIVPEIKNWLLKKQPLRTSLR
ncbi:MAG: aminoacyl-tRNA hydrolase [Patescibacteria group bacterium]|nr:aminoacyl-tRNA hydrolase [Patescibacteria group bacterium]